jgi:hypothetical protein
LLIFPPRGIFQYIQPWKFERKNWDSILKGWLISRARLLYCSHGDRMRRLPSLRPTASSSWVASAIWNGTAWP